MYRNWTSEKTQDHLDVCAADGTSTSLTFHIVHASVTKTLAATWHKRDAIMKMSSRWAAMHTSQSFMPLAGVATVATTAFVLLSASDVSRGLTVSLSLSQSVTVHHRAYCCWHACCDSLLVKTACGCNSCHRNRVGTFIYTVSQKNCANLYFAPCLSNIYRFQWKLEELSRNKPSTKLYLNCPLDLKYVLALPWEIWSVRLSRQHNN